MKFSGMGRAGRRLVSTTALAAATIAAAPLAAQDAVPVQNIVGGQYLVTNDDLAPTNIYFDKYSGGSAVAVPKGSDDVVAVINEVIKENQDNGNIDQWVDEMTKKAVANAQSK